MATDYPAAIDGTDTLPNPGANADTNSPSLSSGQTNQNDALKAVETKLGTGASVAASGQVLTANGAGSSVWAQASLTSMVTGVLPVANGGSGVTSKTGTGALVLGTSPTIASPTISGTASVVALNASGLITGAGGLTVSGGSVTLPNNSIATSALNFQNTGPDANGWHKKDYGNWQVYEQTFSGSSVSIGAGTGAVIGSPDMPVGITDSSSLRFYVGGAVGYTGRVIIGTDNGDTSSPVTALSVYAWNITGGTIVWSGLIYVQAVTI